VPAGAGGAVPAGAGGAVPAVGSRVLTPAERAEIRAAGDAVRAARGPGKRPESAAERAERELAEQELAERERAGQELEALEEWRRQLEGAAPGPAPAESSGRAADRLDREDFLQHLRPLVDRRIGDLRSGRGGDQAMSRDAVKAALDRLPGYPGGRPRGVAAVAEAIAEGQLTGGRRAAISGFARPVAGGGQAVASGSGWGGPAVGGRSAVERADWLLGPGHGFDEARAARVLELVRVLAVLTPAAAPDPEADAARLAEVAGRAGLEHQVGPGARRAFEVLDLALAAFDQPSLAEVTAMRLVADLVRPQAGLPAETVASPDDLKAVYRGCSGCRTAAMSR